jgi:DNA-binding winged helix-turn-helix (wHTH) protein/Flp pilus assembly protein TadD
VVGSYGSPPQRRPSKSGQTPNETGGGAGAASPPTGSYRFGPFNLEISTRTLSCDGFEIALRPTVAELLLYLVSNPERLITKEELLEKVWPDRFVEETNIRQTVFTLRRALGDAGEKLILTVPGRGYRFTGVVETGPPLRNHTAASPASAMAEGLHKPARVPRLALVLAGGTAAVVAAVALILMLTFHPAVGTLRHVVLADFANNTRDPVFDKTLMSVLRVELGQSPYLSQLSDPQIQETLGEMGRPKDATFTPIVAQEVCMRTNSDEVIAGSIVAAGSHYILTLTATDCSGHQTIAEEGATALRREDVVDGLEHLIRQIRGKLGEPIKSVDQFSVPLEPERTASLDALKAYSEGIWLNRHGQADAAVAPLQRAVTIDPNFAAAYLNLAVIYNNLMQADQADNAVVRAYALRDRLNERQQISADVDYSMIHTGDMSAMLRALQGAVSIYPSEWGYWADLANAETTLGNWDAGAVAAQRAVALKPAGETPYLALADAQMARGKAAAARQACLLAISRGFAGPMMHAALLDQAIVAGDEHGQLEQIAWAHTQPDDNVFLLTEGRMEYRAGRIRQGDEIFRRLLTLAGGKSDSDPTLGFRARMFDEFGFTDRARALVARAKGIDNYSDYILAVAQVGDPKRAQSLLARQLAQTPRNTLLQADAGEIQAALAMRRDEPQAAIAALEPGLPYEARGFDEDYLLGKARLATGDLKGAESAFQTILDHPGWYPESPYYPLAQLWLARCLLLQGQVQAARAVYAALFTTWRDADPDFPLLKQARLEAASGRFVAAPPFKK